MTPDWTTYHDAAEHPVKDRSRKVTKRRGRMRENGRALKRLLNERAAKAQRSQHTPKG
jgi:hypothetical protein